MTAQAHGGYIQRSISARYISGLLADAPRLASVVARDATAALTDAQVAADIRAGIVTSSTAQVTTLTLGTSTAGILAALNTPATGSSFAVKYVNTGPNPLVLTRPDTSASFTSSASALAAFFVVSPGRSCDTQWVVVNSSFLMIYVVNGGVWASDSVELSEATVLASSQSGTTYRLTGSTAGFITLPAPSVGINFKFYIAEVPSNNWIILSAAQGAITGTVCIAGEVLGSTAAHYVIFDHGNSTIGDYVQVFCVDGVHWAAHGFGCRALAISLDNGA
jgi:hypothetical protein